MKTSVVMRLTVWLADIGGTGTAGDAFAGDLMESLAQGRSRWWCFSQALQRVVFLTQSRLCALLVPIYYCVAFVFLYPLWQQVYALAITRLLTGDNRTVAWPGSALLEIVAGLLPAVLFVWAGVFGFLLLRHETLPRDVIRVTLSLSVGCSMVCAETVLRLGSKPPDLRTLSHADFYYPVFHAHFSVLLFFALFAAVVLLPREHSSGHRQKVRRIFG